jgi:hypothetical protein
MPGLFLPALATAWAALKSFDESGSELDGLFSLWCDSDDESDAHPSRLSKARRGMPPAGRVDVAPEDKRVFRELAQTWERLARIRQKDITPDDLEIRPESKL